MAHTLKLSIWRIVLTPTYNEKNPTNETLFEILKKESGITTDHHALLQLYYNSFKGAFKKSSKGNKSFGPTSDIHINSNENFIYGFLEGGTTGIDQEIKDNSNITTPGRKVKRNESVMINHFFMLWLPKSVNYGYVFLQSFTDIGSGLATPFFEHLSEFLSKYRYRITKEWKVPKPIQESFKNKSVVTSFNIVKRKTNISERKMFNPSLMDASRLAFKFAVTGLKLSIEEFKTIFSNTRSGNIFHIDLSEIGLSSPNDYIVNVEYTDETSGKKVTTQLADILNIKPSIIIPDNVKANDSEIPDLNKILNFCIQHLKQLQREDRYSTNDEYKGN